MDLFKNIKGLKAYCTELSELCQTISVSDTRVKIGKFKIIETPSKDAAIRLHHKIRDAIISEQIDMSEIYTKIESTLSEIQIDLFKEGSEESKEDNTLKFGSKVK